MSILEGFSGYYKALGVTGVICAGTNRLFGAPKEITVSPRGIKHPVHVRPRTSDISLYKDFLLRPQIGYGVELPFTPRFIVDAGANVGMASIVFANLYPHAKIVAVEPEPSNFAMLHKNCAPYSNIMCVNAALWDSDCELKLGPVGLHSATSDKWAFQVSDTGVPVRGITMKTLMRESGLAFIDLLKMDIEGGEIEAFANSEAWMRNVKAVFIELHDSIRLGCKAVLDKACQGFEVSTDGGEMTFYVRH